MYDAGVPRAARTQYPYLIDVIEFGTSPSTLYGYNNESTGWDFETMSVSSSGVTVSSSTGTLINGFGLDMVYAGGRLYFTSGKVVDVTVPAVVATLSTGGPPGTLVPVQPHLAANRIFLVTGSGAATVITSFDIGTFNPIQSLPVPATIGTPVRLIKWGADGLAFTTTGNQVVVVQGSFVFTPPPTTITADPTPTFPAGTITATWANVASPTAYDWIGLYAMGAANANYLASRYTTGAAGGSGVMTVPSYIAPGSYELRLFANGSFTRLATGTLTVAAAPAMLEVGPTSASSGSPILIGWNGIPSPNATDWLGLYPAGAPHSGYVGSRYTTGTGSGRATLVVPPMLAPGAYELRLFANSSFNMLALAAFTVVASSPTVVAEPGATTAGSTFLITWSGITSPSGTDWLALYPAGGANSAYMTSRYTTGTASGRATMVIPYLATPGQYELRLFASSSFNMLALSTIVVAASGVTIYGEPPSLQPTATVLVNWSGITSPSAGDWIGLYPAGAAHSGYLGSRYTTGTAAGLATLVVPMGVAPGAYELRLFANSSFTLLAIGTLTITATSPLITVPSPVTAGTSQQVSWSGIASPSPTDWIGLYAAGAPHSSYLASAYTNGTSSGNVTFQVPAAPGSYEFRLFANSSFTVLAVVTVTITP